MDIDGLAARLGVPRTWVRDAVTARRIPHTRIGRHVRFTEGHLAEIVAAGEQPVHSTPSRLTVVPGPKAQKRSAA